MQASARSLLKAIVRDLRLSWKALALTDLAYKIISFIVLAPIVGFLFRAMLALSGQDVLADQDILFFIISPVGLLCCIIVGSLWLGIGMLEQTALMGILYAREGQQHVGVGGALKFAIDHFWSVIQITGRLIVYSLLVMAPFLVVAGLGYFLLLTEYDINYYLKEKPPVFFVAVSLGGIIVVGLLAVLLNLLTSWLFALPLILFEEVSPSNAFKISRERTSGHRRTLLLWIVGWALASVVLSTLVTSVVIAIGRWVVPGISGSFELLALVIGGTLLVLGVISLVLNLLQMTSLSAILFHLYLQLGSEGMSDGSRVAIAEGIGARWRLSRTHVLVAGILGVGISITIGVFVIQGIPLEDHVAVTAHRGSSKAAPENTLSSIKLAIEEGADWVEIDVQETADGEVVVFHDSDFMKLAGVNTKVWDVTMPALQKIDVGSRFSAEFAGERVPTLGEVLDVCKGKVGVNIELKYYGHDEQLEQRVVEIVESHDMESEIVIMSLKLDAIKKMKALRPNWKAGLLMSVSAGDLQNVDVNFLAINASFANRSFIRSSHSIGKEVYVWTVNDVSTMSTMIGRGVDNLITDKPALARAVIEQRAQMSPLEHILLGLAGIFGVSPEIEEQ